MLKQRLVTALLLAPLAATGILYLPNPIFALAWAAVLNLAAWEWSALGKMVKGQRIAWLGGFNFCLLVLWFYHDVKVLVENTLFAASLFWIVVAILMLFGIISVLKKLPNGVYQVTSVVAGLFILVPAWLALVSIHDGSSIMTLLVFCLVWVADIGAYFCGKRWGSHKLAPAISPGKSWEGVVGGLLAVLVFAFMWISLAGYQGKELIFTVSICVVAVIASVYGDLLESVFKRVSGIKDSGQLLPGHGGIMDRLDSITAAAPVFASLILLRDIFI